MICEKGLSRQRSLGVEIRFPKKRPDFEKKTKFFSSRSCLPNIPARNLSRAGIFGKHDLDEKKNFFPSENFHVSVKAPDRRKTSFWCVLRLPGGKRS